MFCSDHSVFIFLFLIPYHHSSIHMCVVRNSMLNGTDRLDHSWYTCTLLQDRLDSVNVYATDARPTFGTCSTYSVCQYVLVLLLARSTRDCHRRCSICCKSLLSTNLDTACYLQLLHQLQQVAVVHCVKICWANYTQVGVGLVAPKLCHSVPLHTSNSNCRSRFCFAQACSTPQADVAASRTELAHHI